MKIEVKQSDEHHTSVVVFDTWAKLAAWAAIKARDVDNSRSGVGPLAAIHAEMLEGSK